MEPANPEVIHHELRLEYTPATCDKCGATVAFAEACPCGRWRGKPDPLVEQRRTALAGLIEVLSEPLEDHRTIDLANTTHQVRLE